MRLSIMTLLLTTVALSGCAYMNNRCADSPDQFTCGTVQSNHNDSGALTPTVYSDEGLKTRYSHKLISDYVEQMVMEMLGNHPMTVTSPIAVASFVHFDSTLARTDVLGNQLAESFIHELQALGLPVVDYKVTGAIRITPRGDFAFSRDVLDLANDQAIGFILSGTLIQSKGGIIVNARIVGLTTKRVVASAETFIPGFVLNKIYPNSAAMG